ncbi:hypothetical protein RRG08_066916, partial [Elysia crispata]
MQRATPCTGQTEPSGCSMKIDTLLKLPARATLPRYPVYGTLRSQDAIRCLDTRSM